MSKNRSIFGIVFFVLCVVVFVPQKVQALGLQNASASASTSRPSPSSPLSTAYSSGVSGVTVINNVSTFLASDSATFFTNGTADVIKIATTSADRLTLAFTANTTSAHNATAVIAVPITAMHTMVFTPQTAIPIGGKIIISYPTLNASDTNQASPSASGYMFNNLSNSTDIQMQTSLGAATCSWAITGTSASGTPTATCTTAGATIPAGATVWVFLGCTASTADSAGGRCTTQKPLIINPTNNGTSGTGGTRGTATVKSIQLSTQDGSTNILDASTIKIGTIESVFVVAHVDPTFSFNIDGVAAGTLMTSVCTGSYASITTNSSYPSTGTEVNLGTISSGGNTYAAQLLTIRSNTGAGYVITATSSGFLLRPDTGQYIVNAQGNVTANDSPAPSTISSTTGGYGISACDASSRVSTTKWGQASPNFANPSPQFYYTLVNYSSAPASSGDAIYAVYGARAGGSTPPGDYWQIITYNATVTF